MITIVAIGKKHEPWLQPGLERYQKRLTGAYASQWVLLPHSQRLGDSARQDESQRLQKYIDSANHTILLDETGAELSSPQLADALQKQHIHSKKITFIIGGAYGVSQQLRQSVDFVWSLSPLVFPHQLVRLILIEQLYRAQTIAHNQPYHHS